MSAMPELSTRDTDKIRRWAEARQGKPMAVKGKRPGAIRINFPGYLASGMDAITWEEFSRLFKERGLEFRFEEKMPDGGDSRFFKLVDPN